MRRLSCEALAGFEVHALVATLPSAIAAVSAVEDAAAAVAAFVAGPGHDAALRAAVRDVLRQRGYRPTGRGKPSSEYLANAAAEGRFPVVNAVVDAGNVTSLQSGLPISVVDADLCAEPWQVRPGAAGERFVFNASGQEIDIAGLPCLCDREGPCANAVKDAQRTKTTASTRAVLAIVWGAVAPDAALPARTAAQLAARLRALGARIEAVEVAAAPAS